LEQKRILVVDDDQAVLKPITRILELQGYTVDTAETGKEAIEKSNLNIYNLALVDVRLPDMEGTKLLTAMRETTPRMIKVILTGYPSAENRAEAAKRHADGYIVKPVRIDDLLKTVKECLRKQDEARDQRISPGAGQHIRNEFVVVAIGASAGGPKALELVLSGMPSRLHAAFVVSQHIPEGFTKALAHRLAAVSTLRVREADFGDMLQPGDALIAPGGYNMAVAKDGRIRLEKAEQIPAPSIDTMMKSIAGAYGSRTIGVLLTGMLTDGVLGMKAIKEQGGITIVQDEASSVVYGMPKAALEAGAADHVVNISDIPNQIINALARIAKSRQSN
jgi:two-component system chemotaxis response regulator CheB